MAVEGHLPSIQNALSDHQFSALKLAFRSFNMSQAVTEDPDLQLTGLYNHLVKSHSLTSASSLMYQMLLRVISPDETDKLDYINSIEFPNNPDIKLDFKPAFILKTASILERMEKAGSFQQFRDGVRVSIFQHYDLDHIGNPTKLLQKLVENDQLDKNLLLANMKYNPSETFVTELQTLFKDYGEDFPIERMDMVTPSSNEPFRRKVHKPSGKAIVIGSSVCICVIAIASVVVVIAVFGYYLTDSLTSETSHVLYAPVGRSVTSLISCYDRLTKSISVMTESDNFDIVSYEIEEKNLQIVEITLPRKVLAPLFPRYGSDIVNTLNYDLDNNPIYTASDGTIGFEVQLSTSSEIICPLKIVGFNNYFEYMKFQKNERYSSYAEKCFMGNITLQNHTASFGLVGSNYYFFLVQYSNVEFEIIAYANISQYSTTEHLYNCTVSADNPHCSFPTVDLFSALKINAAKKCLVTKAIKSNENSNNATVKVTVQSHVRSVYSGSVMIAVFVVNIICVLVIIAVVCIYWRRH